MTNRRGYSSARQLILKEEKGAAASVTVPALPDQAEITFLPLRLLADNTFLPPLVLILALKP